MGSTCKYRDDAGLPKALAAAQSSATVRLAGRRDPGLQAASTADTRSLSEITSLARRLHATLPDVAELVGRLVKEQAGLGAVIGGSYAYGTPRDDSDFDVTVVVPHGPMRRSAVSVGSCCMDVWTRTPTGVRAEFRRHGLPGTLEIFCFGVIALDTDGVICELQAEAREQWAHGPPVGSLGRRAPRLRHLARVFDALAVPTPRRIALRAVLIDELLSYWHLRNGRYRRAPTVVMDEIMAACPDLVRLLYAIEAESGTSMGELVHETLRLIDHPS